MTLGGGALHGEPRARLPLPGGLQGGTQDHVGLLEDTQEDRSDVNEFSANIVCYEGVVKSTSCANTHVQKE